MNDTEEKIVELQRHSMAQDARISNFETKFEMFMQSIEKSLAEMRERDKIRAEEMRDFKNEMRTQNILRAKEIAELSQKIEHAQEVHNADMKEVNEKYNADMKIVNEKHNADMKIVNDRIESKFDKLSGQVQNIVIAAVIGVGAVVVGVVSFVISVINK